MARTLKKDILVTKTVKAKRPPKTIKERAWTKKYIETGNQTQAALEVYDIKGKDPEQIAANIGNQNYRKLQIDAHMDKAGISDERLYDKLSEGLDSTRVISANVIITKSDDPTVKPLKADAKTQDFIEVPDYAVQHKWWASAMELKGHLNAKEDDKGERPIKVVVLNYSG